MGWLVAVLLYLATFPERVRWLDRQLAGWREKRDANRYVEYLLAVMVWRTLSWWYHDISVDAALHKEGNHKREVKMQY